MSRVDMDEIVGRGDGSWPAPDVPERRRYGDLVVRGERMGMLLPSAHHRSAIQFHRRFKNEKRSANVRTRVNAVENARLDRVDRSTRKISSIVQLAHERERKGE